MTPAPDLCARLAALADLLGRNGEGRWAAIVARARAEGCAGDEAALARAVLGWFAGPGSLAAVVLSPAGGHALPACAIDGANRALARMRAELRAEAARRLG